MGLGEFKGHGFDQAFEQAAVFAAGAVGGKAVVIGERQAQRVAEFSEEGVVAGGDHEEAI